MTHDVYTKNIYKLKTYLWSENGAIPLDKQRARPKATQGNTKATIYTATVQAHLLMQRSETAEAGDLRHRGLDNPTQRYTYSHCSVYHTGWDW